MKQKLSLILSLITMSAFSFIVFQNTTENKIQPNIQKVVRTTAAATAAAAATATTTAAATKKAKKAKKAVKKTKKMKLASVHNIEDAKNYIKKNKSIPYKDFKKLIKYIQTNGDFVFFRSKIKPLSSESENQNLLLNKSQTVLYHHLKKRIKHINPRNKNSYEKLKALFDNEINKFPILSNPDDKNKYDRKVTLWHKWIKKASETPKSPTQIKRFLNIIKGYQNFLSNHELDKDFSVFSLIRKIIKGFRRHVKKEKESRLDKVFNYLNGLLDLSKNSILKDIIGEDSSQDLEKAISHHVCVTCGKLVKKIRSRNLEDFITKTRKFLVKVYKKLDEDETSVFYEKSKKSLFSLLGKSIYHIKNKYVLLEILDTLKTTIVRLDGNSDLDQDIVKDLVDGFSKIYASTLSRFIRITKPSYLDDNYDEISSQIHSLLKLEETSIPSNIQSLLLKTKYDLQRKLIAHGQKRYFQNRIDRDDLKTDYIDKFKKETNKDYASFCFGNGFNFSIFLAITLPCQVITSHQKLYQNFSQAFSKNPFSPFPVSSAPNTQNTINTTQKELQEAAIKSTFIQKLDLWSHLIKLNWKPNPRSRVFKLKPKHPSKKRPLPRRPRVLAAPPMMVR